MRPQAQPARPPPSAMSSSSTSGGTSSGSSSNNGGHVNMEQDPPFLSSSGRTTNTKLGSYTTTARIGITSVATSENTVLLVLVIVLSTAYVAHRSHRQKNAEKKASERKRRLLGITTTATNSSSSSSPSSSSTLQNGSSSAMASSSSTIVSNGHNANHRHHPENAASSSSSSFISSIVPPSIHALLSACARISRIQASLQYIQELPRIKRLLVNRRRRRKDTIKNANNSDDSSHSTRPQLGSNEALSLDEKINADGNAQTPSKDKQSRGRTASQAGQLLSSSPQASKTQLPNANINSPSRPTTQHKTTPRQPSSSTASSAASSRTRSITQSRQQQQQQRHVNVGGAPMSQKVLKDVAVQVTAEDLLHFNSMPETKQSDEIHDNEKVTTPLLLSSTPAKKKGKTKSRNSSAASSPRAPFAPLSPRIDLVATGDAGKQQQIPVNDSSLRERSEENASPDATLRKTSLNAHSVLPGGVVPEAEGQASIRSPTTSTSSSSTTGRSASLSVSTDATGRSIHVIGDLVLEPLSVLHSITGENQNPHASEPATPDAEGKATRQKPTTLENSTSQAQQQKTPPTYSFHTGFQEPTTSELEEGEIDESSPRDEQHHGQAPHAQRRSLDMNGSLNGLFLPTPPDSSRKIRVDAQGYPSIPLPSTSSSSASVSAASSPSASRRTALAQDNQNQTPVSSASYARLPSGTPVSPSDNRTPSRVQERVPHNANLAQHGHYGVSTSSSISSVGQPGSSYGNPGSTPTSPPAAHSYGHDGSSNSTLPPMHPKNQQLHTPIPPPFLSPGTSTQFQSGLALQQQQAQIQQYIVQAQHQYQGLLFQSQLQHQQLQHQHQHQQHQYQHGSHIVGLGHPSQSPSHQHHFDSAQLSPKTASRSASGVNDGYLSPTRAHMQSGNGSSSGGSNRSSSLHNNQSQTSYSSRSASPQPSLGQSTASYSVEANPVPTFANAPAHHNQTTPVLPGLDAAMASMQQQQQHQHQMTLAQKMQVMQAQIQFALQQNQAAQQQQQQNGQYFQSGANTVTSSGMTSPLTQATRSGSMSAGLPSPLVYNDAHQHDARGFGQMQQLGGMGSPISASTYAYQAASAAPGSTSPYHMQHSQYHYVQSPTAPGSANYPDGNNPFPTIRRRQSTPALSGDVTMTPFGGVLGNYSQASGNNGSPYMSGKKRNRRNSRPYRVGSYGHPVSMDSQDFISSPIHDSPGLNGLSNTNGQHDAEFDMSSMSSSYNSTRPNVDRRRSSLIPPPSPLLQSRKERRTKQREKDTERQRQMELDDEEVTNNEDDIKADLELLAKMQEQDDLLSAAAGPAESNSSNINFADIAKRMKAMETVLERRGKELEIARWKLKCVEVDRRSIEIEHQKALTHFYERAERAEARLRLADNPTAPTDASNDAKSSPEISSSQIHDGASVHGESSVQSEGSQVNSDWIRPSLSISFSSTAPHLAYSTDAFSPTSFDSASYHFSDSPYNATKYPPHPFASDYKSNRKGRRGPRVSSASEGKQRSGRVTAKESSPKGHSPSFADSKTSGSASLDGTASSDDSESDEDIEILLDVSCSRSPSIQPTSRTHSRVPSGMLDNSLGPMSASMTENKTVGLGIASSSPSSSQGEKEAIHPIPTDFVGSLPSFTISHPPGSPSIEPEQEKK